MPYSAPTPHYRPSTWQKRRVSSYSYVIPDQKARVHRQLRQLGLSRWGRMTGEARYLPKLIHPQEQLGGVVYGNSEAGLVMVVATDRRIIYIDYKPFFMKTEEINYDVVSGVTLEWVGWSGTVVLHTRMGDYTVRTANRKAAEIFRAYLEKRCIEHQNGRQQSSVIVRRNH
ncbi:MAG TPA: PH domain-containing protein [Candidatus Saccharimonadales bacterium]|nr:PH domain-containing protein [Candidatus Saccharimonadales bacterium]